MYSCSFSETIWCRFAICPSILLKVDPKYSAIKINGKPAYKLARKGKNVQIEPRQVTIYELELVQFKTPLLQIRVQCSSGTYIRSLAADIGEALKVGAYLTDLRRTQVGSYRIEKSKTLEELKKDFLNL